MSRPQGHSAARRITSMENSNDTIGIWTRYIPVCSAVSQPTAPSPVPLHVVLQLFNSGYRKRIHYKELLTRLVLYVIRRHTALTGYTQATKQDCAQHEKMWYFLCGKMDIFGKALLKCTSSGIRFFWDTLKMEAGKYSKNLVSIHLSTWRHMWNIETYITVSNVVKTTVLFTV
jgi:hypothetical protein